MKARLLNNGETTIYTTNSEVADLAPITRIGGGEVRVDTAYMAPAAAWDDESLTGSLSFGFHDVDKNTINLFKTVRVRNYSGENSGLVKVLAHYRRGARTFSAQAWLAVTVPDSLTSQSDVVQASSKPTARFRALLASLAVMLPLRSASPHDSINVPPPPDPAALACARSLRQPPLNPSWPRHRWLRSLCFLRPPRLRPPRLKPQRFTPLRTCAPTSVESPTRAS